MGGLVRPDSGQVWFCGERMTEPRMEIGFVFQQFNLYPHLSVLKNITLAPIKIRRISPKEAEAQAMALLERVGLPEKRDAHPAELSGIFWLVGTALMLRNFLTLTTVGGCVVSASFSGNSRFTGFGGGPPPKEGDDLGSNPG